MLWVLVLMMQRLTLWWTFKGSDPLVGKTSEPLGG